MHRDKHPIDNYLRTRGEHDRASQVEPESPDDVDDQAQGDLLSRRRSSRQLLGRLEGNAKGFQVALSLDPPIDLS